MFFEIENTYFQLCQARAHKVEEQKPLEDQVAQSAKAMESMFMNAMSGFAQTAAAIMGNPVPNIHLFGPAPGGQAGEKHSNKQHLPLADAGSPAAPAPLAICNGSAATAAPSKAPEEPAQGPDADMSLEAFEERNAQQLRDRDQKKKPQGKASPQGVLKKPAASSKATKVKVVEPKTTSTSAPKKKVAVKLGCLRCRGSRNGCVKCQDENFQGMRVNREEWKAQQKLHKYK